MTRKLACTLALGTFALLAPATGSAQTFVDVGVWTPGGGGRVIVGGPPVYRGPVYPAPGYPGPVYRRPIYAGPAYRVPVYPVPVYRAPFPRPVYLAPPVYVVQPYYRHDRGRHRGWSKRGPVYVDPYGRDYGRRR